MRQAIYLSLFVLTFLSIGAKANTEYNHHKLTVSIDLSQSYIDVTDTIILSKQELKVFYLNSSLSIYESNCEFAKINSEKSYTKYEITNNKTDEIILKYKGVIANNKAGIQNITHKTMFESTTGIIFDNGIYLAGQTYWVPDFETASLKTFSINVKIDPEWLLTSQGNIIKEEIIDSLRNYRFNMDQPTNQVCLIGNKWTKYTKKINQVDIHVYLINHDEALAQKYLNATSEYLKLYKHIIGDFPYSKFDVIENFWESGYGMPSFTLLGKRVMRFPWILNTSYPHELLHNYWGNSVYVDYDKGNWCEGITTYMADHLLKEKDGEGALFRRSSLKKYTDYVHPENDFPINKFKSKYDEASEAIGYGKVLMLNHMLRVKYGTDKFLESYTDFYLNHQFETASFNDIQRSFEKITGDHLDDFFDQWIAHKGAPALELNKVKVKKNKDQYELRFDLSQSNTEKDYNLEVPVFVYLNDSKTVERKLLHLNENTQSYSISFPEKPIRIDIDPQFDVMRTLNAQEVPPSLSQILGSNKWTIVLPKKSKAYFYYKNLAISWSKMYTQKGKEVEIVNDNKMDEIPTDHSVWILGAENVFAKTLNIRERYKLAVRDEIFDEIDRLNTSELVVYTISNPANANETVGYMNANDPSIMGQISMKLMHYGSFSYFGFEGKSMQNTLKGSFPVLNSPLNYMLSKDKHPVDWSVFQYPKTDLMYK